MWRRVKENTNKSNTTTQQLHLFRSITVSKFKKKKIIYRIEQKKKEQLITIRITVIAGLGSERNI